MASSGSTVTPDESGAGATAVSSGSSSVITAATCRHFGASKHEQATAVMTLASSVKVTVSPLSVVTPVSVHVHFSASVGSASSFLTRRGGIAAVSVAETSAAMRGRVI